MCIRDRTDDVPIDTVDPLTVVAGLRYDNANGNWGGELLVTAVDKKDRVSSDSVAQPDNYTIVDLIADWELGDSLSLRLGVFNLFDEEYAHWQNIQGLNAVKWTQKPDYPPQDLQHAQVIFGRSLTSM